MRFKLIVEYDGTHYQGWQVQPNGPTIQSALEDAIARMLGETTRVTAAGRTDAGVHASGQVVAVTLGRTIAAERLLRGLNALTPPDISIRDIGVVADDFDPRRAARSRVYVYRVWNAPWRSPFWGRYAWHVPRRLDVPGMQTAAACLLGEHDFSSFRAAGCEAAQPVRRVLQSRLDQDGRLLSYTIEATGFLRHMVRNIIGTLVEVGTGERTAASIPELLAACDRTLAGPTAPPRGLCLVRVNYPV